MGYISLKAVHRLVGNNYPMGVPNLVKLLEEFCLRLESSDDPFIAQIPKRLLRSNLAVRSFDVCEMEKLDADFRLNLNVQEKSREISLLNYAKENLERPTDQQRIVLHINIVGHDGMKHSIHVPFQALVVGWGDVEKGYQGYAHSITFLNEVNAVDEQRYYVGISSRNWLKRMAEHLAEVRRGSNKLFHRQWRDYQGDRSVRFGSELVVLNHTYEGIMAWEEEIVRQHMESGTSLNMIPGGFEGMKVLHEHRFTQSSRVSLEERDRASDAYYLAHPRLGLPNLLVSQAWKSDDYYQRVITGRDNTLSADQVRRIRILFSENFPIKEIMRECGARSVGQVKRVLDGTTYGRIK